MALPPVVRQTAPWPKRSEAPANFSTMADAVGATMPNTIDDLNTALKWQADSMAATADYKTAAGQSATAASDSATLAQQQVGLAAGQVVLAKAQADAAKGSAESAQVSAAAAGSAAGLPSLVGNAKKVLGVKADETGVGWVLGLPDFAANAGKTLQVNSTSNGAAWVNLGAMHVTEEKPSGVNGGSAPIPINNDYFPRTLNTIRSNTLLGASMAAGVITLPAGSYRVRAWTTSGLSQVKCRLYNITSGLALQNSPSASALNCMISLSVVSSLRLEMRIHPSVSGISTTSAQGVAFSSGDPEVYSDVVIERVG